MTLNLDMCKRCRIKHTWWNKYDESRWEKGVVICVINNSHEGYDKHTVRVDGSIPKHCRYAAEHAVLIGTEDEKCQTKSSSNSKTRQKSRR